MNCDNCKNVKLNIPGAPGTKCVNFEEGCVNYEPIVESPHKRLVAVGCLLGLLEQIVDELLWASTDKDVWESLLNKALDGQKVEFMVVPGVTVKEFLNEMEKTRAEIEKDEASIVLKEDTK